MTLLPISNRSSPAWALSAAAVLVALSPNAALAAKAKERAEPLIPPEDLIFGHWETFTAAQGLPDDRVRAVLLDGDRVWVGTDGGLARLEDERWSAWTEKDGLPPFPVQAIAADPATRDLWIATFGGGLARMSGGRFHVYSQFDSGLAGDVVFDVQIIGEQIWAATNGGLSLFHPVKDEWRLYYERRADRDQPVITELAGASGRLVALEWRRRAIWLDPPGNDPAAFVPAGREEPTYAAAALDVLVDRAYAATVSGAVYELLDRPGDRGLGRATVVARAVSWPASPHFVLTLAAQTPSILWLGTTRQLHQVDARRGVILATYDSSDDNVEIAVETEGKAPPRLEERMPPGPVRAIAFGDNYIWVGTDHGLARGSRGARSTNPNEQVLTAAVKTSLTPHGHNGPSRAAVAVYGPYNRTIALAGSPDRSEPPRADLVAVELAVDEARRNGQPDAPLEVLTVPSGYARYGWGLPEDEITYFVRNPAVVGIVGAVPSGQSVTAAVASNTPIAWLNTAAPPGGGVSAADSSPMIFECRGDEPRQHRRIFDEAIGTRAVKRIAILSDGDIESRRHVGWWRDYARIQGVSIVFEGLCPTAQNGTCQNPVELKRAAPEVVFFWGSGEALLHLLRGLRAADVAATVVTGPAGAGAPASEVPETIRLVALADESPVACAEAHAGFVAAYQERGVPARRPPDETAFRTLHAASHLIAAIETAGANREAIGGALAAMHDSCLGERHYEQEHPARPVMVAELINGAWQRRTLPAR